MDAEGGEPDEQAAAAPEARMRAAAPASGVKKPKARVGGSTKIKVRGLLPACHDDPPHGLMLPLLRTAARLEPH